MRIPIAPAVRPNRSLDCAYVSHKAVIGVQANINEALRNRAVAAIAESISPFAAPTLDVPPIPLTPAKKAKVEGDWRAPPAANAPDVAKTAAPLLGTAALRAGQSPELGLWQPAFRRAIEHEAAGGLDLLYQMERAWSESRRAVSGRRKDTHHARATDAPTAASVLSATTLVRNLGIVVKCRVAINDRTLNSDVVFELPEIAAISGRWRRCRPPPCNSEPASGLGRSAQNRSSSVTDLAATCDLKIPGLTATTAWRFRN